MSRALLFCALAACGGADAMPAPAAPAPSAVIAPTGVGFFPGESMTFDVSLAGITAGEAALAVGQAGIVDGHHAIVVTSRAATTGAAALVKSITDEATTVIDLDTGAPLVLDTAVEMSGKRSTAHAVFEPKSADVTFVRDDDRSKPRTQHIAFGASGVLDSHAAMAQIRTWRPAPGATRSLWVIGGRRVWRVDVRYVGNETIGSALGNRATLKLEGGAFRAHANLTVEPGPPTRTFTVWLTDDADRVPLKLSAHTELGEVGMTLIEYNRP
jgi:hypothetical protein